MTIVIDVGCATYGGDESISYLIEEFQPHTLIGYDPAAASSSYNKNGTTVILESKAAWLYHGLVGFRIAGLGGHVELDRKAPYVPCVDLADVIFSAFEVDKDVVLKMDAEGAEYQLLPHLVDNDADLLLRLAWIEWHCEHCQRGGGHREGCRAATTTAWDDRKARVEGAMRCDMHEWNR